ncbi:MAG: DUF362 domain-containing protein [bacterium]
MPDPDRVEAIIRECFEELGAAPRGRVLIKPNVVTANREYIHHSYTHQGVIEGLIRALKTKSSVTEITIGESSGFGIPPGLFLREAGYDALARRMKVRLVDFNQDGTTWAPLKKGVHHKGFHAPHSLLHADTKIWAPKLKYHICCEITNALKLNIGLLCHRERMLYHDDRLNEKIVDLLELGFPDLVVSDATVIGHGYESAPQGFPLGLILVANDPLAADATAGAALGYAPEQIVHLRIARDRGYGTIALADIEITGDYPLDELAEKTRHIVSEYQDIHKLNTPLKFYCGNAPDRGEFCYGGCLAAVKGCLGTTDKRRPGAVRNARPGAIVTGIYEGDVIHPEHTVLLIGDCTRVNGRLVARRTVKIPGCPIGTSYLLFRLPLIFGMPTPASDLRSAVLFIYFSIRHFLRRLITKIVKISRKERRGRGAQPCAPTESV